MGSLFEAVLLGPDDEHLDAVASAVREEVERIERLLSRFDPRSELARINRQAANGPVRVDHEMFDLLDACRHWWKHTDGYFDIAAAVSAQADENKPATMAEVVLDPGAPSVMFARPGIQLDMGGVGKGYALDSAAEILAHFSVERFFLTGGTSSNLARGLEPDGQMWRMGVRDPWAEDPRAEICQLPVVDRATSYSAITRAGQNESDIIQPCTGRPLAGQAACLVFARLATEAEILSTALVAMGKARAAEYIGDLGMDGVDVAWIDRVDERAVVTWLGQAGLKPAASSERK